MTDIGTREEIVDILAVAIRNNQPCGLTIDGEHVFCTDLRAEEPCVHCSCRASAEAYLSALEASGLTVSAQDEWRTIDSAPKSTSEDTPHGKYVRGIYLLGYCPDEALDPLGCIDAIWWEPNEKGGRGAWFGAGATEVRRTHWKPIGAPPLTAATLREDEKK